MEKILILHGNIDDRRQKNVLTILHDILKRYGTNVTILDVSKMKIAHCTGCFLCWTKSPGECVKKDAARDIVKEMVNCEMVILFTQTSFGGYSSELKIIVDRFLPLLLPYFKSFSGEMFHSPRYAKYPRLVGIGISENADESENDLYKTLVGRNAINFHAPSYASDMINPSDNAEMIGKQLNDVLFRSDTFPSRNDMQRLFPTNETTTVNNDENDTHKALLIVGSPKTGKLSTSAVLGEYLIDKIEKADWETESVTLKANLCREKGGADLCKAVDRADLVIMAFPLHSDSLPFLVTKALEIIAHHIQSMDVYRPKRLFVIVNNGYAESHHNGVALSICRRFASECGLTWAGSLAMGAGEVLGKGYALTAAKRPMPSVKHVIKALDRACDALLTGQQLPHDIQKMISKAPVPLPFRVWWWMFMKIAIPWWRTIASENGVNKKSMKARPYELL